MIAGDFSGPGLKKQFVQAGFRQGETLFDEIKKTAQKHPYRVAARDAGGRYTYAELVRMTLRIAGSLFRRGVAPGDVVALQLPSIKEFVPLFLAVERLGAIVAPMIPSLAQGELASILPIVQPKLFVSVPEHGSHRPYRAAASALDRVPEGHTELYCLDPEGFEGAAAELVARDVPHESELPPAPPASALCELAFTSGTTGEPKGVLHAHSTSLSGIRSTAQRQDIGSDDVVHVGLPVGHNFGYFYALRLGLVTGATVVLQPRWSAEEMLRLADEAGVTVTAGTPTHLADLLEIQEEWGDRLDKLRLFTCAGAKLSSDLAGRALQALPGRLSRAFGMTEIGHVTATGPDSPTEKVISTEGSPQPEITMKIVSDKGEPLPAGEQGHVSFAGPFLFRRYVQGAKFTSAFFDEKGFFRTGDLGMEDEDGYLIISGRQKELVIRGGEKIAVGDIEGVLSNHEAVADVAVIGVPDPRLGERPVACVRSTSGRTLSFETMVDYLRSQGVTKSYWPEALVSVQEIPRNETGKILRQELRRTVGDKLRERRWTRGWEG